MKLVARLIEEKGGDHAFAAKVDKTVGCVRVWKCRNNLPREAWPEIMLAFPDIGLRELLRIERLGRQA